MCCFCLEHPEPLLMKDVFETMFCLHEVSEQLLSSTSWELCSLRSVMTLWGRAVEMFLNMRVIIRLLAVREETEHTRTSGRSGQCLLILTMILHPPPVLALYVVNRKKKKILASLWMLLSSSNEPVHPVSCPPFSKNPFLHNTPLLKTLSLMSYVSFANKSFLFFTSWSSNCWVFPHFMSIEKEAETSENGVGSMVSPVQGPALQRCQVWLSACSYLSVWPRLPPFCLSIFGLTLSVLASAVTSYICFKY